MASRAAAFAWPFLLAFLGPGSASAGPATVGAPTVLSGPSPFAPDGCGNLDAMLFPAFYDHSFGTEREASIAANPATPGNVVAAWVQDNDLGIVVASSFDGGVSWQRAVVPGLTICDGGSEERVFHPRLSFGPDGRLYLAAESQVGKFPDPRSAANRIPVATSTDGGLTWTTPVFLNDPLLNGFTTIAAEPDVPGAADVVWHGAEPELALGGTYVSRTTDGGRTWTRSLVRRGRGDTVQAFDRVIAHPDGTLLVVGMDDEVTGTVDRIAAVFGVPLPPVSDGGIELVVHRSGDKGGTWEMAGVLSGNAVSDFPSAAVGPSGEVYAAWSEMNGGGLRAVKISRSDDVGVTWTPPVTAATIPGSLFPGIAVASDGTVGLAFTDQRNDVPNDDEVTSDVWFTHSHDGGITWSETHVAGPFAFNPDLAVGGGLFEETTALGSGFAMAFVQYAPAALDGRSDVFFATSIEPGP